MSRLFATIAVSLAGISAMGIAQAAARQRLAGVSYMMRVTSAPRGATGATGAMTGTAQNYVGRAVFAANRGRMDIVEGGVESLFATGDYILFDSTDLVVVHPATKEFTALPHDVAGQTMERLQSIGVKMTIGDEKVVLDSLGPSDSVAGIPTMHYRMTTAFTMSIDAGIVQQRLATESVTDYWVATVPGLPGNPLLRANGLAGSSAMTGLFKDISDKVDSAAKRMGSAVALKTSTVNRLIDGQGVNTMMEQTSTVSDVEHRAIDAESLVLPANYTVRPLPGIEAPVSGDAAAKWRLPPLSRLRRVERRDR